MIRNVGIAVNIRIYDAKFKNNEFFIGIRPSIQEYGPFLRGYESTNMSKKWQENSIPIVGNNYWTMGRPSPTGSSLRFDPNSDMYQAWFGVYTHVGSDRRQYGMRDREPDIEILRYLAEVDQDLWLHGYGDDNPVTELTEFAYRGKLRIDGRDAWLYYGEMCSHSDVGFSGRGHESAYGMVRNRRLVSAEPTTERFFIPDQTLWQPYVAPHHNINLKGYFAVVPCEMALACIYLNGAEYTDSRSRHHDTWPRLRPDAIDMIESVKIETNFK